MPRSLGTSAEGRRRRTSALSSTLQSPPACAAAEYPLHTSCVQRSSDTPIGIESPTPIHIASDPDGPPEMLRLIQLMLARYRRFALTASARNAESGTGICGLTY